MSISCTGTLNHLSLPTTDPRATAAFLAEHFGCHVVTAGDSILLQRNGFDIVLDHVEAPVQWPRNFHLGFEMATLQEAETLYSTFEAAGVFMETAVFNNARGSRFFCRTPEGVMIEVNTREDKGDGWRKLF